jgi:magnesium chelatase family protein
MLSKVYSAALVGLETISIEIEVEARLGIPQHIILGLPDAAVKESKQRILSAIKNAGFNFLPDKRLTINLAPADLKKEGPVFDLPIAIASLMSLRLLEATLNIEETLIIGELNLEGKVKSVRGVFAMMASAQKLGFKNIILPQANIGEVVAIPGLNIFLVKNLSEAVMVLKGQHPAYVPETDQNLMPSFDGDFSEIKGQSYAKRALEIAAAGGHNVLLMGTPGCGKTLMATRFATLLPPLSHDEMFEVSRIYSVAGQILKKNQIQTARPFRSPHHQASQASLVGGGTIPRPGEITLAHRGVLFLDEMAEFPSKILDTLRQPLEAATITIARANATFEFPADFILIGAMNPCPCGYIGHPEKKCLCNKLEIERYQKKLSGPVLDRIDLLVEVAPLKRSELTTAPVVENSETIRQRVLAAREVQNKRGSLNHRLTPRQVRQFCILSSEAVNYFEKELSEFGLSARGYDRLLKVSRTIADLEGSEKIECAHLAEALQYKTKEIK